MFRFIISISFVLCLAYCFAYSATTPDVKEQPKNSADNALWTDISLKEPSAQIQVEYKHNGKVTNVTPGATLEKVITGPAPKLFWQLEKNAKYTLAMIDPDTPSHKEATGRSWLHWLAVNLERNTIPHDKTLTHYNGPSPPKGSGHHRYVFLVFKQSRDFDEKVQNEIRKKYLDNVSSRGGFNMKSFASEHGLGEPVAYNYLQTVTQ